MENRSNTNRRTFLSQSSKLIIGTGLLSIPVQSGISKPLYQDNEINIIGPKAGYTPQVGTLVSMLNWMRDVVVRSVRNLDTHGLDYLLDEESNSIGAMLWHLAAIERVYQEQTFDGKMWSGLSDLDASKWSDAEHLGDNGRANIKGYDIDFYLDLLDNVRTFTLAELRSRDDEWLMRKSRGWGSTVNNYCKWFHVCEHESNHNGQIKFIKSRIL